MDITFKVILDRIHPKKDSTFPVRLRVFKGRNYKEYSFGIAIPEKDWNEQLQQVSPTNDSHLIFNTKISSTKAKLQRFLLLSEDDDSIITLEKIINHLNQNGQKKADKVVPDILDYGKKHIEKLKKGGHIGNSIVYSCAINKLKEFAGEEKLSFEEVTYSYIERFNTSLLSEGMKVNGVANYLRTIRAIFNKAIKESIISDNLYSRKTDQHFKIFVGFNNRVCLNLKIWSDGYMGDLKVSSIGQLSACIRSLLEQH